MGCYLIELVPVLPFKRHPATAGEEPEWASQKQNQLRVALCLPPCRITKHGSGWVSDLANLRIDCPA